MSRTRPMEKKEDVNVISVPKVTREVPQLQATRKAQKYTKSQKKLLSALDEMAARPLVEYMQGLETLQIYTSNLVLFPDEKKYRKVKLSNFHYQERLGHLPGSRNAMGAIGYIKMGDYLRLDDKKLRKDGSTENLVQLRTLLHSNLEEIRKRFRDLPNRLDENHKFTSVAGVGSHGDIGKRQTMEDDEIIIDNFCGKPHRGYFGLYDGHGGRDTVNFVVKVLHDNLERQLELSKPWAEAIKESYIRTDAQLRKQGILRSGSTSVSCVIDVEHDTSNNSTRKMLHTANVGDSRAILVRNKKAIRLTVDHKPNLAEEKKRIESAGGFVGRNNRVNGVLAISRALGDHLLKEGGIVSAEPYVTSTELTPKDTHLILACDGVWDVMDDQEAVDIVIAQMEKHSKSKDLNQNKKDNQNESKESRITEDINTILQLTSKRIVQEALDRRTLDNVTVTVVKL